MRIAVVTGASSGMGREFARQIGGRYGFVQEIWLISRDEKKLRITAQLTDVKCRVIPLDLTDKSALENYASILESEMPEVCMLVNAAGFGKFGAAAGIPITETNDMIELNVRATVNMTLLTLPYMCRGGRIINMSSVSAFTPLPYFNIYAATKAFVLHFGRALSSELKNGGITVTSVCPYWVKTDFIDVAKDVPDPGAVTDFIFIRKPGRVVAKALDDSDRGKTVSLYGIIEHSLLAVSKLVPQKLQMAAWNLIRN